MDPDAESIRRAVMEPWCVSCGKPEPRAASHRKDIRPPLFDRDPDARPPGLEWCIGEACWCTENGWLEPHQAAAMIVGYWSPRLAKAINFLPAMTRASEVPDWERRFCEALASDDPVQALAALMHRHLDSKEQDDG